MFMPTQQVGGGDSTGSDTDVEADETLAGVEVEPEPFIARLTIVSVGEEGGAEVSAAGSASSSLTAVSSGKVMLPSLAPGKEIGIREGVTKIGRDETCDIQLDHLTVSHHHCTISLIVDPADRSWTRTIVDCNSSNGTFLQIEKKNQYRVSQSPNKLIDNHTVVIGLIKLRFELDPPGVKRTRAALGPVSPLESGVEDSDSHKNSDPGETQAFTQYGGSSGDEEDYSSVGGDMTQRFGDEGLTQNFEDGGEDAARSDAAVGTLKGSAEEDEGNGLPRVPTFPPKPKPLIQASSPSHVEQEVGRNNFETEAHGNVSNTDSEDLEFEGGLISEDEAGVSSTSNKLPLAKEQASDNNFGGEGGGDTPVQEDEDDEDTDTEEESEIDDANGGRGVHGATGYQHMEIDSGSVADQKSGIEKAAAGAKAEEERLAAEAAAAKAAKAAQEKKEE
eukprot:g446.t1